MMESESRPYNYVLNYIWSDNLQLPYTSKLEVYMESDKPTSLCATSNFLTNTTIDFSSRSFGETFGDYLWGYHDLHVHLGRHGHQRRHGHHGRNGHHGRHGYHGRHSQLVIIVIVVAMVVIVLRTERTERTDGTGQTNLTFQIEFQGNLFRTAFAILALFLGLPTNQQRFFINIRFQ